MTAKHNEQIKHIKSKLDELRQIHSQGAALYGADYINPPISETELRRFEKEHEITVPEEYRRFLLEIGNGGAGPYRFGVYPLTNIEPEDWDKAIYCELEGDVVCVHDENHPFYNKVEPTPFSSLSEYMADNWKIGTEFDAVAWKQFKSRMQEKALIIGTRGCSLVTMLVVTGPLSGQIWVCDQEAMCDMGCGFWPETLKAVPEEGKHWPIRSASGETLYVCDVNPFGVYNNNRRDKDERMNFLEWYECWLDAKLSWIESHKEILFPHGIQYSLFP